LDLSSWVSIRRCAADFVTREQRLDLLYLNAGIIRVAPGVTAEGYESHFGINYLGHALLARFLLPTMLRTTQRTPGVRIVTVSSEGHRLAPKGALISTGCRRTAQIWSVISLLSPRPQECRHDHHP
jgi:retinol dehydrogenase-12